MGAGAWVLAARPKTLPAVVAPVAVGTVLGAGGGTGIAWLPAAGCLVGGLLIQIGTNFANDAFDALKGTDNEQRLGPTRAVAAGLIPARTMLAGTALVLGLAFLVGLYLSWVAGWPILVGGLISLVCAVAYTGGPFPLAYHGLGDLFVLVFFGWFAVLGSAWVQSPGSWPIPTDWWLLASAIGLQATAIIAVNNQRDRDGDAAAGKRTLAVRLGDGPHRLYVALVHAAAALFLGLGLGWAQTAFWLAALGGAGHAAFVALARGRALNAGLGLGAALELATAIAIGVHLWSA